MDFLANHLPFKKNSENFDVENFLETEETTKNEPLIIDKP